MENDDLLLEVEELRAQLAELKAEKASREAAGTGSSEKEASASESEELLSGYAPEFTSDELKQVVEDLADTVGKELKKTNPVTLIATFALGVLVGRLFSK